MLTHSDEGSVKIAGIAIRSVAGWLVALKNRRETRRAAEIFTKHGAQPPALWPMARADNSVRNLAGGGARIW
jgi:hypothetical protein